MIIHKDIFNIDCEKETERISNLVKDYLVKYKKRGLVVAISGGIDSALCAYLACNILGRNKVLGIYMPEKDIVDETDFVVNYVVKPLDIKYKLKNITDTLNSIGCYKERDKTIKNLIEEYDPEWKHKIVIQKTGKANINYFYLVVQDRNKNEKKIRLPHKEFLELVSATNFKQRIRKNIEYYYADKLNYAVLGTSNFVEVDQGFFVKNGDGSADIKAISHLYKTQVYQLAKHLGVNKKIYESVPTTNTYSLYQEQDEFYFSLPFPEMDYALWGLKNNIPTSELSLFLNIDEKTLDTVYEDIKAKNKSAEYIHAGFSSL